jgi:hypothetical protein
MMMIIMMMVIMVIITISTIMKIPHKKYHYAINLQGAERYVQESCPSPFSFYSNFSLIVHRILKIK